MRDVHGERGVAWLDGLPKLLDELAGRWSFVVETVVPELTYSFVAFVRRNGGEKCVLKLVPPGGGVQREIAWYRAVRKGAARLHESDGEKGALLLERLEPGDTAKSLIMRGDDDGATRAICRVIKAIDADVPAVAPFRRVTELSADLEVLRGHVPDTWIDRAASLFANSGATDATVLHGDLHHGNVLLGASGWVAIDPHGYFGPRIFEVGAMLGNPYEGFPKVQPLRKTLQRRISILAEELGYESDVVADWGFAYMLLASAWSVEDHGALPKGQSACLAELESSCRRR